MVDITETLNTPRIQPDFPLMPSLEMPCESATLKYAEGASDARPFPYGWSYAQGVPPTNAATDPSAAHKSASRNFIGIVLSYRNYEDLTIPGPESVESI
jgi:hypothetical protein